MFNFSELFGQDQAKQKIKEYGKLFDKLTKEYPSIEEETLVISSCIAGLMARVAYVDFHLDKNELIKMKSILTEWNINPNLNSNQIVEIAVDHIKEMAGLENHLYVKPLNKLMNKEDRFRLLEFLFIVAASDGKVEALESEEIRIICKGLELSNQHFLSARADVAEFLKALS